MHGYILAAITQHEEGRLKHWRGTPESAEEFGVLAALEVMMPMRDGVRLATDIPESGMDSWFSAAATTQTSPRAAPWRWSGPWSGCRLAI